MILSLILCFLFIFSFLLYVIVISYKNYRMTKITSRNRKLFYEMLKEFKKYGVYNDYIKSCRFQTVDELLKWFNSFDTSTQHFYMLITEPVINKSQMPNYTYIVIKQLVYNMYRFNGKY